MTPYKLYPTTYLRFVPRHDDTEGPVIKYVLQQWWSSYAHPEQQDPNSGNDGEWRDVQIVFPE